MEISSLLLVYTYGTPIIMPNLNSYKAVSVRSINPPFAIYLFIYLFIFLNYIYLTLVLLWYLNIIQNFRNISPVLFRVQN